MILAVCGALELSVNAKTVQQIVVMGKTGSCKDRLLEVPVTRKQETN